jgi:ketosteroid isomerase-like protein
MTTEDEVRAQTDRVLNSMLDSMRRNDMRTFADQWAPDGVMEFPFAPPGYRTLHSRDEVWDYVKDYTSTIYLDEVTEHRRHHTLDPATVVLEFSVTGKAVKTGNDYSVNYISVVTVGANGIRHYRDYWNGLAAAAAIGGIDTMMADFGQQQGA